MSFRFKILSCAYSFSAFDLYELNVINLIILFCIVFIVLSNIPFSWAVSEHHAKEKRSAWLDKLKTTNVRHQTQTRFCHFLAVTLFLSLWGRVLWLPVGKVTFACFWTSLKISSDWLRMGAVQTCASPQQQCDFWMAFQRKLKWKKS